MASNNNTSIQLIVVPPNGLSSFTIDTTLDAPISSIMADIAKRTSIPAKQQVLTHQGNVLKHESGTIRELNVQNGAHLNVSPSLPGGCGCNCSAWCLGKDCTLLEPARQCVLQ